MFDHSFIKWAGGKAKLLPEIHKYILNTGRSTLIEPFFGSGVVSYNTPYTHYKVNDSNRDLCLTYQTVASYPETVIDHCYMLFEQGNSVAAYKHIRDEFNNKLQNNHTVYYVAAMFIYLNKHCWNGLCRYNSSGEFNTPPNDKVKLGKQIKFDANNLRRWGMFLKNKVDLYHGDFEYMFSFGSPDTTIYADPPYIPVSNTANFTAYTTEKFSIDDHKRLAAAAERACAEGSLVVISNSWTPETMEIYNNSSEIIEIKASRVLNSNTANRGKVSEALIIYRGK